MGQQDATAAYLMDLRKCLDYAGQPDGLPAELATMLAPDAMDNAAVRGNELLVLEGTRLHRFSVADDGSCTQTTDGQRDTTGIARLVGATQGELYALGKQGGLYVSTDDARTWRQEQLADDGTLLPTKDVRCIVHPLKTNDGMVRVMLIGTRPGNDNAEVWLKIVNDNDPDDDGRWFRASQDRTGFLLPTAQRTAVVAYDDTDLAFSVNAAGQFPDIVQSADGGITWHRNTLYTYPDELAGNAEFDAAADADNCIWLVCGGTGQVWRGRLNRLGWATQQTSFDK